MAAYQLHLQQHNAAQNLIKPVKTLLVNVRSSEKAISKDAVVGELRVIVFLFFLVFQNTSFPSCSAAAAMLYIQPGLIKPSLTVSRNNRKSVYIPPAMVPPQNDQNRANTGPGF